MIYSVRHISLRNSDSSKIPLCIDAISWHSIERLIVAPYLLKIYGFTRSLKVSQDFNSKSRANKIRS